MRACVSVFTNGRLSAIQPNGCENVKNLNLMSCCHVACSHISALLSRCCSHINVLLSRCLFPYQCPVVTLPVLISMSCCHVACSHISALLNVTCSHIAILLSRYLLSQHYPFHVSNCHIGVLLPCYLSVFCCHVACQCSVVNVDRFCD